MTTETDKLVRASMDESVKLCAAFLDVDSVKADEAFEAVLAGWDIEEIPDADRPEIINFHRKSDPARKLSCQRNEGAIQDMASEFGEAVHQSVRLATLEFVSFELLREHYHRDSPKPESVKGILEACGLLSETT